MLWSITFGILQINHTFGIVFSMKKNLTAIASVRFGVNAKGMEKGPMALVQSSAITEQGTLEQAYFNRTNPELITFKEEDLLRGGDVLLIGKGSMSEAAVWHDTGEPAIASSTLFVIRPDNKVVVPAYLAGYLNSRPAQAQMTAYRKVGTVHVLSRKALDSLEVPIPSLVEQHKLVQLADAAQRAKLHLNELNNAYTQLLNAVWATYPRT